MTQPTLHTPGLKKGDYFVVTRGLDRGHDNTLYQASEVSGGVVSARILHAIGSWRRLNIGGQDLLHLTRIEIQTVPESFAQRQSMIPLKAPVIARPDPKPTSLFSRLTSLIGSKSS